MSKAYKDTTPEEQEILDKSYEIIAQLYPLMAGNAREVQMLVVVDMFATLLSCHTDTHYRHVLADDITKKAITIAELRIMERQERDEKG